MVCHVFSWIMHLMNLQGNCCIITIYKKKTKFYTFLTYADILSSIFVTLVPIALANSLSSIIVNMI